MRLCGSDIDMNIKGNIKSQVLKLTRKVITLLKRSVINGIPRTISPGTSKNYKLRNIGIKSFKTIRDVDRKFSTILSRPSKSTHPSTPAITKCIVWWLP